MKQYFAVTAGFRGGDACGTFRWSDDAASCEREFRESRPDTVSFRCQVQTPATQLNVDDARAALIGQWGLAGNLARAQHPQLSAIIPILVRLADDLTQVENLLKLTGEAGRPG